jgi:hypothetical protein
MVGRSLAAVATLLLCLGTASSEPLRIGGTEIKLPTDWRSLPELVAANRNAKVPLALRVAFGDPTAGCYLLVQETKVSTDDVDKTHRTLLEATRRPTFRVSDFALTKGSGVSTSTYRFQVAGIRGQAQTRLHQDGRVLTASCFWTTRAQEHSEATCHRILEDISRAP